MGLQWSWEFFEELLIGLKVQSPDLLDRLCWLFWSKDIEEFEWEGRGQTRLVGWPGRRIGT